jgi:hypothetical protein
MHHIRAVWGCVLASLLLAAAPAVAANVDVPSLESEIADRLVAERLHLGTAGAAALTLTSASVTIHEALTLPVSFTYFVGESDDLGTGVAFTTIFGDRPISTSYRGFLYFPDSIRYDSIHTVAGTGMKLALDPIDERYYVALYAYQDGYFYEGAAPPVTFEPGHYSVDLHSLADLGKIKLEAFAGATAPVSTLGYYRGGLLFYAGDEAGEFLAEVGVPRWDPTHDSASIDLFFILFEARIYLGFASLVPTVFLHPAYYLQNPTDEAGLLDFNLALRIGDNAKSLLSGGLETNVAFKQQDLQDLEVKLAPFTSFATPGALWQLKVDVQVFPSIDFEAFVGVKAEF